MHAYTTPSQQPEASNPGADARRISLAPVAGHGIDRAATLDRTRLEPRALPAVQRAGTAQLVDLGRKLYVAAFLRESEVVRSLGFAGPRGQEGTTFLATA